MWDVFAVSTYVTVSVLFWYMGLIPDLATLPRPRASKKFAQFIYGMFSLGLARLGPALAPLRDGLPAAGRPGDAAGALGALGRQLRLRRLAACPAGTRRSSRPTSSPAPSLRVRDGADAGDPVAQFFHLEDFITDAPHRQHGQGDAGDRA